MTQQRFTGLLTLVNVPSDEYPTGSRGHLVILTKEAAEASLSQLIGMPLNYHPEWETHALPVHLQAKADQGLGYIDTAEIKGNELLIGGFIVDNTVKFPPNLGMSYELEDCHVPDMRAEIWTLDRITFNGAAVLLAIKAAYKGTWFKVETEVTQ